MRHVLSDFVNQRVLVCGSRMWQDMPTILDVFKQTHPSVVIHGGALGADKLGALAAWLLKIPVECYPADWRRYGREAGLIRNQQMLDEGKPALVLAFQVNDSPGTADMIRRAELAGVPVHLTKRVRVRPALEVPNDV